MDMQPRGRRVSNPPPAEPKVAVESSSPDAVREQRLEACEARIEHLETALEGLQDALYRHEVREKEIIAELQRRIDPEQMARDLSQDARKRGLS
jgi:hypothetical protein